MSEASDDALGTQNVWEKDKAPEPGLKDMLGRPRKPTIYEAMAAVMAELPAIPKDQLNTQQNFRYRGIDQVMTALHPLLAKQGIFFAPDVVERIDGTRPTRGGGTLYTVLLHVRYTFYGPGGDSFTASGWGEGTDAGDKATNKAMTGAMKYVLFQVFAVGTDDAVDPDASSPDPAPQQRGQKRQQTRQAQQPPKDYERATEAQVQAIEELYADRDFDLPDMLRKAGFSDIRDLPVERAHKLIGVMEKAPVRS